MAKSNKPIVWFPFAAGGTVIAFFIPVIVLLTLLVAFGKVPAGLSYAGMQGFLHDCVLAKLVVFGVVVVLNLLLGALGTVTGGTPGGPGSSSSRSRSLPA